MKKIFLIMTLCASSVLVFAQNDNHRRYPPTSVQRSWQRDYPDYNVNDNNWQWQNNRWHTRYTDKQNNRSVEVYYDRNGRRMYERHEWNVNDVPDRVRDRIRSRYHTNNYQVYRVERPGSGFYFQISLGGNRMIYLDERGREVRNRYY